jgi:N6-adenosine-specific RNA methylase IME4
MMLNRKAGAGMNPFAGLRRRHFALILADPPWPFQVYSEATGSSRAASNHYRVMDLADICGLPVADYLAARNAALYLWATAPFLEKAFTVIAAWGFQYSTNIVWTKDKFGTGYWCRSQHEHLLIGRRGNFRVPKPADRPPSVIQAPRREHSRKPDQVYSIIERAYPELPKIELFARHARLGWTAWGDEAPSATQDEQNGLASPYKGGEEWIQGTLELADGSRGAGASR